MTGFREQEVGPGGGKEAEAVVEGIKEGGRLAGGIRGAAAGVESEGGGPSAGGAEERGAEAEGTSVGAGNGTHPRGARGLQLLGAGGVAAEGEAVEAGGTEIMAEAEAGGGGKMRQKVHPLKGDVRNAGSSGGNEVIAQ